MKTLLLALLLTVPACGPWLYAESVAPPGAVAWLDTEGGRAEITEGVALAFRCEDDGPCARAVAASDDPAIAEVRPAALARLEMAIWRGMQPASSFVVIGKRPGTTRIRVRSKDGDTSFRLTVLPASGEP